MGLYAEDGVLLAYRQSEDSYTQQLVHRVWAIQNEKAFAIYAASQDLEWSRVTSKP